MSPRPLKFRGALMGRTTVAALVAFAGLASMADAEAASEVRCGDRITRSVTLTKDLHCKKDGLKVGADGIGIDLGGHTIFGPGKAGTKGIQNSGFDNVSITTGTVRGFDHGIELRKNARGNEITAMDVRGGRYGLVLFDSRDARVDGNFVTAGAAEDGYKGGSGAAFALYRSHDNHFEENYSWGNGVNMVVLDNSHRNNIGEFNFVEADGQLEVPADLTPSQGTGLLLRNSDKNNIGGNVFAGNANDGIFIDTKSTGNRVGGNLAVNNGRLGMNVRGKNIDGGGNRAFGNGWVAQCRGIVCAGS